MLLALWRTNIVYFFAPLLFLCFWFGIFPDTHSRSLDDAYVHAADEVLMMKANRFFCVYTFIHFDT